MALIYDEQGNVIGDDSSGDVSAADIYGTSYPVPIASIAPGEETSASVSTGDTGYFSGKIAEFQRTLYAVDEAASALESLIASDVNQELTEDDYSTILAQLDEYYSRREAFKFAAEAFNSVSSMVNAVGGSLPQVNIPQGLGFAPLVIPAALAAAIAGATVLISWAIGWLSRSEETAAQIAAKITDPIKRDAALAEAARITAASQSTGGVGGALSSVANVAKWGAVAFLAWIAYQTYSKGKQS